MHKSYLKKNAYARSIQGRKIVFVSGSNSLFGIETHLIEKWLGIPTVNMGMHAGLQTDYPLYAIKQFLHSGDIVILPFEFELYKWNGVHRTLKRDFSLTYDRGYFEKHLSIREKILMLQTIKPLEFIKSLVSIVDIRLHGAPLEPKTGMIYTSETLNKNGDETRKEGQTQAFIESTPKPLSPPLPLEQTRGIQEILAFNQWCKERRIYLFVTFPNTMNFEEYYNDPYTTYFAHLIKHFKDSHIPVIGQPTDFLYPKSYFYDTNYHLNSKGSKIRTYQLLQRFKESINNVPALDDLRNRLESLPDFKTFIEETPSSKPN